MMADVPLGAFLSGGIDSSSIVALMADASLQPVNSFSIGFQDGTYNELPYARAVAERFSTNHRERTVSPDLEDLFERLIVHLDEPFADVSLFPTFLVSQLAREHVTVALSGDGGDELFGGYDAYQAQELATRFAWMGDTLTAAAAAVAAALPPTEKKKGLVNKFKRFTLGATQAPEDLGHYRWMVYLGPRLKGRLYAPRLTEALAGSDVYRPVRETLRRFGQDDLLNRQLYTDLSLYLADDILVKVDRMSMATSLETRAPFLDADVMELAFSMPGHLKIRNGERKWILKQAMQDVLPSSILNRRKEGFSIPMKNWLRRELQPLMRSLLSPARIAARGLFDPSEVVRLIDAHVAGRDNHAHTLFPLMVFERWCDAHLR
jgi:asparagine synthase (glutamine-hydrolysing)